MVSYGLVQAELAAQAVLSRVVTERPLPSYSGWPVPISRSVLPLVSMSWPRAVMFLREMFCAAKVDGVAWVSCTEVTTPVALPWALAIWVMNSSGLPKLS